MLINQLAKQLSTKLIKAQAHQSPEYYDLIIYVSPLIFLISSKRQIIFVKLNYHSYASPHLSLIIFNKLDLHWWNID